MSIAGERRTQALGRGYEHDALNEYASAFKTLAYDMLRENQTNIFKNPMDAVTLTESNDALKSFFMENSCDRNEFDSAEAYDEHMNDMAALYENDREAVLEYSSMAAFNPVIGLTFPIHKNILMNASFEKAFQKVVAQAPKFTLTLETRILTTPEGKEIDMFKQQNELTDAINASVPFVEVPVALPENETKNILVDKFNTTTAADALSIQTYVSAVLIDSWVPVGGKYIDTTDFSEKTIESGGTAAKKPIWFPVDLKFVMAYGAYDRQMMEPISVTINDTASTTAVVKGIVSGYMKKSMFMLQCSNAAVKAVKINAKMDSSNAMVKTCSVSWRARTDVVEIPEAVPFNTPVSPEEVKDIGALYQTNQLTKIMSMIKDVMLNYKDDMIHKYLDNSFLSMDASSKLARTFDFAPRQGYYADAPEYRRTSFMDVLDTYATQLIQVLNDPNMTITVIGRPDLIRKITPTEYTYQTPSSIGPVQMDFTKTVTTSDKRVYQFISSDKMRGNNNLIVVLNPRNTERLIYRIYDYQMYVSNEIRNSVNYALPAIHAFERWKMVDYQPVQGRVKILNPTGIKEYVANDDPIGTQSYNDFQADLPESARS